MLSLPKMILFLKGYFFLIGLDIICTLFFYGLMKHTLLVQSLYRAILRTHMRLPDQLRTVGDSYVKEEFKHHKQAGPEQTRQFLEEWLRYLECIHSQLEMKTESQHSSIPLLGDDIHDSVLHGAFTNVQRRQLLLLKNEIYRNDGN